MLATSGWLALRDEAGPAAGGTAFPELGAVGDGTLPSSGVPGFPLVRFHVEQSEARQVAGRAALADTEDRRRQGLTGRSDIGGLDAMIFVFEADINTRFTMRNVPVPLSIAWFDAEGRFVDAAEMAPCIGEAIDAGCPLYGADRPFRYAIEVLPGDLGRLEIGPGAVLVLDT